MQEFIEYDGVDRNNEEGGTFFNCVRGVDGTTAVDSTDEEPAILLPGRASLLLAPNVWSRDADLDLYQMVVSSGADLVAECHVYEQGSRQRIEDPTEIIAQVAYSWVYVGTVDVPDGIRSLACLI
jgi:hypothetical protein